jgi:hypothetical protein
MYRHKAGFHPPQENVARHCRSRYRLMPSRNPNPEGPPLADPNPALWIVHYSQSEPQYQMPAAQIPMHPAIQHMLATRRMFQSHGGPPRKEFLLNDRNSWPTIPMPGQQMPGSGPGQLHPSAQRSPFHPQQNGPGGRAPPQPPQGPQFYQQPPQGSAPAHASGPPPAKRQRQGQAGPPPGPVIPPPVADQSIIEDEEDTWRGDLFDHLTPREISATRYVQHHEWMEEVFSSPYAISQITPIDLGLSLKGDLEDLTKDIWTAFSGPNSEQTTISVGKLPPGKADEFRQRVSAYETRIAGEIAELEKTYLTTMDGFRKGSFFIDAEKRLRSAHWDSTETSVGVWRLDISEKAPKSGSQDEEEAALTKIPKPRETVDSILKDVESHYGRKTRSLPTLTRVQDGGLQESQPIRPILSPQASPAVDILNGHDASVDIIHDGDDSQLPGTTPDLGETSGENDVEMANMAGSLLDELVGTSGDTPIGGSGTPLGLGSSANNLGGDSQHLNNIADGTSNEDIFGQNTTPGLETSQPTPGSLLGLGEADEHSAFADALGAADILASPKAEDGDILV